jgi:hypothetical protein
MIISYGNWNVAENVVLPTYIVLLKHRRCKQCELLGMPADLWDTSARLLRARAAATTCVTFDSSVLGSQRSNEHCWMAFPPVLERRSAVNPNDSMTVKLASRVIIGFQVCSRRRVSTYAPWTNRMVGSLGSWPAAHPSPTTRFYDLKEEGSRVRGTNL